MLSFIATIGRYSRTSTMAPKQMCTQSAVTPKNITAASKCVGCEGIGEALSPDEVRRQRELLIPGWNVNEDCTRLNRSWKAKNFAAALDFLNKVGEIAEAEQHHPDIAIRSYNHVDVVLWTHSLGGVTENDLILAVKIDTVPIALSRK